MSNVLMHPPADRRCQIYVPRKSNDELVRCVNPGTHWERWGGCDCDPKLDAICENEYFSWECDGHEEREAAA